MKTLYESILDDEDILVNKSIKDSQNPFILIYKLFEGENDWKDASFKYHSKIEKIIKDLLGNLLPKVVLENLKIRYYDDGLGITVKTYIPIDLITIEKNTWGNWQGIMTNPNDEICVRFPNTNVWNKEVKIYGFKTKKEYWEWMEKICRTFNLNIAKKDIYYYSI
jgi:hypothetical protein